MSPLQPQRKVQARQSLALFISCSDGLHIKIDPVQTNCDMLQHHSLIPRHPPEPRKPL